MIAPLQRPLGIDQDVGDVLYVPDLPLAEQAHWLEDLITELLAFPHGRHDDQVDSIAQALAWLDQRKRSLETVPIVAPFIGRVRNPYREAFPDYGKLPR